MEVKIDEEQEAGCSLCGIYSNSAVAVSAHCLLGAEMRLLGDGATLPDEAGFR